MTEIGKALLLWGLLVCGQAQAQTVPKAIITGPKEAPAGDMVVLDATQSSGSPGYLWLLVNSEKSFLPVEEGRKCVFSSRDGGKYIFVLVVVGVSNNGGPLAAKATHELTLIAQACPVPTPAPTPTPVPDPTPPPPAKLAGAVILVEKADMTPEVAKLINEFRKNKELSRKVTVLDKDAMGADDKPLQKAVDAVKYVGDKPLPRVLGVGLDGSFVFSVDVPATVGELVELLKSMGM